MKTGKNIEQVGKKKMIAYLYGNVPISIILFIVFAGILIFFLFIQQQKYYSLEDVNFETNVVSETSNDQPVQIDAQLYIPLKAKFPIPVVVIAPSSGGVEEVREIYYAKELSKQGIAALIVDSFKSRGLKNSLYNQSQLESWQVENDAIAALRFLRSDERFDKQHIAIMGVSKGGTVAMDSAFNIRRKWAGVDDIAFNAHVAISPECNWTVQSDKTTGAAMLFLLAELDDQTPSRACLSKIEKMKASGNEHIEARVYKGIHHAWEELGWFSEYDKDIENYSKCNVSIQDDGTMFAIDTKEIIPEKNWYSWAKENCMTYGARCCGGSSRHKQKATQDIISFLRRQGF